RAAPVPALAHVVGIVERRRAARLELGELQLLPQPVDDLVDLQLDHEADLAVLGAARLRGPLAFLASRLQHLARLAAPLARALPPLGPDQAQPRVMELTSRSTSRRCSNRYCSTASCSGAWLSRVNFSLRL